jgi:hypothetical protein
MNCGHCHTEIESDGHEGFVHVVRDENDKAYPGTYMCFPATRKDNLSEPRFQLSAIPE